jgi:hypothetical protein
MIKAMMEREEENLFIIWTIEQQSKAKYGWAVLKDIVMDTTGKLAELACEFLEKKRRQHDTTRDK